MTPRRENPEGDRLARLEATVDFLVSETGNTRQDVRHIYVAMEGIRADIREGNKTARAHFLWTLGILIGALAPFLIGSMVTLPIRL